MVKDHFLWNRVKRPAPTYSYTSTDILTIQCYLKTMMSTYCKRPNHLGETADLLQYKENANGW